MRITEVVRAVVIFNVMSLPYTKSVALENFTVDTHKVARPASLNLDNMLQNWRLATKVYRPKNYLKNPKAIYHKPSSTKKPEYSSKLHQ